MPEMHNRLQLLYLPIIIFACLIAYAGAINSDFVQEDYLLIVNNKDMKNDSLLLDVFRGEDLNSSMTGYYRPITILAFFADFKIWGNNALGYHLTNTVIHILVALLVFVLAISLTKDRTVALLAALLFALHPLKTEVVDYINHRGESICSLFYLFSILTFLRYRARNQAVPYLLFSLFFYMTALLTREGGVTLPAILFILDFSILRKEKRVKLSKVLTPYFLYFFTLAMYLLMRYFALGDLVVAKQESAPLLHRLLTMPGVIVYYAKLLLIPIPLRIYYPIFILDHWQNLSFILPTIFLVLLFTVIAILFLLNRLVFFLSLWPFLILLPNYNFIPIVGFFMAERYLYLPSVGICILMAISLNTLIKVKHLRVLTLTIISIIMIIFFISTGHRHHVWKNQKTYWECFQKDIEGSFVAYTVFGNSYMEGGLLDQAITEYQKALNINPKYKPALLMLGQAFERKGMYMDAVNQYQGLINIDPLNEKAHLHLGKVYTITGKDDIALEEFLTVTKLNQKNAEAHYNLGIAYEKKGLYEKAFFEYEIAVSIIPNWDLPRIRIKILRGEG